MSAGSAVRDVRKKTHPVRDEEGPPGIARPEGSCDNTPEPTLLSAGVSALSLIELRRRRSQPSLAISADPNRCPGCGALQPATAPEGLCPRCLMRPPMTGDTPGPADADATTAPATTGPGHSPSRPRVTPRRPGRSSLELSRKRPRFRMTPPPTGHPTPTSRPAGPTAARPRVTFPATPPSTTSAITRLRKSWAAAAWAWFTRRGRSASTGPWPSR